MTLRAPTCCVGDETSVGNAVNFENARVLRGELHLGSIAIGDHAYVGSYAVLEGNTGSTPGAIWKGSRPWPMACTCPHYGAGPAHPHVIWVLWNALRCHHAPVTRLRRIGEGIFFLCGGLLVATLFFMPVFHLHPDRLARRCRRIGLGARRHRHAAVAGILPARFCPPVPGWW